MFLLKTVRIRTAKVTVGARADFNFQTNCIYFFTRVQMFDFFTLVDRCLFSPQYTAAIEELKKY